MLIKSTSYCPTHEGKMEKRRQHSYNRFRDPAKKKPYNETRWKRFRRWYLAHHPICEYPGCLEPAREIDHIIPLEQGGAHCNSDNSQALCKPHHSAKTARESGFAGNVSRET